MFVILSRDVIQQILPSNKIKTSHVYITMLHKLIIIYFIYYYLREEKNVQQLVASMIAWKTVLQSALPCMLILFWGSWSDR